MEFMEQPVGQLAEDLGRTGSYEDILRVCFGLPEGHEYYETPHILLEQRYGTDVVALTRLLYSVGFRHASRYLENKLKEYIEEQLNS